MSRLWLGALALNVLLIAPLWWRFGGIAQQWIAWEAWVMLPGMLLMPHRWWRGWLAAIATAWIVLVVAANFGELATHMAFGRPLNLYLDLPLLRSVYHLLVGNVGQLWAICAMATAGLVCLALVWWLRRLMMPARRYRLGTLEGKFALVMASLAGVMTLLALYGTQPVAAGRAVMAETTRFQAEQIMATHAARKRFTAELATAPLDTQALPGLADKQVLLTFIESYGVTAIADERYNGDILPTLDEMAERLEARGLHLVTGLVEAPIRGGQSWLAHATTLSGRWIDNQLWYRLMLASEHSTLIDDFKATGQHTLGVMPAISMAWPEGEAYGFDQIVAARDIDYRGPALHWVTMPDQFTLDYMQRNLLGERPTFAQVALISSHAPWTPILPVLDDWDLIGDGHIFAPWEEAGDPPEVVWQDIERIRDHYMWSIDYAVKVTGRWAERVVDEDTLLIALGDHQPAPLVTGENASAAVPVHVVSRDPALLAPFLAHGFVPGALPDATQLTAPPRMSEIRHWLREGFGEELGIETATNATANFTKEPMTRLTTEPAMPFEHAVAYALAVTDEE